MTNNQAAFIAAAVFCHRADGDVSADVMNVASAFAQRMDEFDKSDALKDAE